MLVPFSMLIDTALAFLFGTGSPFIFSFFILHVFNNTALNASNFQHIGIHNTGNRKKKRRFFFLFHFPADENTAVFSSFHSVIRSFPLQPTGQKTKEALCVSLQNTKLKREGKREKKIGLVQ